MHHTCDCSPNALGIELSNSVVILDEVHNMENTLREAGSSKLGEFKITFNGPTSADMETNPLLRGRDWHSLISTPSNFLWMHWRSTFRARRGLMYLQREKDCRHWWISWVQLKLRPSLLCLEHVIGHDHSNIVNTGLIDLLGQLSSSFTRGKKFVFPNKIFMYYPDLFTLANQPHGDFFVCWQQALLGLIGLGRWIITTHAFTQFVKKSSREMEYTSQLDPQSAQ